MWAEWGIEMENLKILAAGKIWLMSLHHEYGAKHTSYKLITCQGQNPLPGKVILNGRQR